MKLEKISRDKLATLLGKCQRQIEAIPPSWTDCGEDLFQIVCAACFERIDRYDPWTKKLVMKIAWNQWREIQRKETLRSYDQLPQELVSPNSDEPSELFDRIEQNYQVRCALDELPEHHRIVLQQRFWEGKTCQQIAEETKKKFETVKTWSKRGLGALRAHPRVQELRS